MIYLDNISKKNKTKQDNTNVVICTFNDNFYIKIKKNQ